eukprot:763951-Hanusia_phi.AAC.2
MWKRAANSMTRGLNMGGNGITHALVEGNALALQAAISCAPRNLRADWLCQVDINGASISPLYWALHDGKFAIVEFILCDLLTIRADIHGYYYGREVGNGDPIFCVFSTANFRPCSDITTTSCKSLAKSV